MSLSSANNPISSFHRSSFRNTLLSRYVCWMFGYILSFMNR